MGDTLPGGPTGSDVGGPLQAAVTAPVGSSGPTVRSSVEWEARCEPWRSVQRTCRRGEPNSAAECSSAAATPGCAHVSAHARARTHAHAHIRTHTPTVRTRTRTLARTHAGAHAQTNAHTCTHADTNARTHACMHTRTQTRTHAR